MVRIFKFSIYCSSYIFHIKVLDRLLQHSGNGITLEQLRRFVPEAYFMRLCRLSVRPKEEILENINLIIDWYKDRKYPVKGNFRRGTVDQERSLVSDRTVAKWEDNKKHVEGECLNDPPGVDVYLLKPNAREVRTHFIV